MNTPSTHTLTTRAMFGLLTDTDPPPPPALRDAPIALVAALAPGHIALITGPSGAGKSTLARAIINQCSASAIPVIAAPVSGPDAPPATHEQRTPVLTRPCDEGPGRPPARCGLPQSSGSRDFWAGPIDPTPIDLLTGPLPHRLRMLASVGLADARLFVRPARLLSIGERARLDIALALDAARRLRSPARTGASGPILILDEFASTLDRPTAMRLSRLLRRRISRTEHSPHSLRVVCLTAHDDLVPALNPDHHIHITPAGCDGRLARPWNQPKAIAVTRTPSFGRIVPPASTPPPPSPLRLCGSVFNSSASSRYLRASTVSELHILYQPGAYADYAALAHHHYRAARPAMLAGPGAIRRAIDAATGDTVGVLVVAMPTLNASWRPIAWPGWFSTADKRESAARLSRDLRTIARVIVAPSHRGLGIASALVRRYLADPLTPATEALAAMGHACPFFESAGMTAYRLPPTARDARLLDALRYVGLTPASLLGGPPLRAGFGAQPRARRTTRDATTCAHGRTLGASPRSRLGEPAYLLVLRELRLWANRSRCTRHLIDDPAAIAARAAQALLAPPVAFAHVAPNFARLSTASPSNKDDHHAPLLHAA